MKLLLISGFLGSGKTTLLLEIAKRLTADGGKVAIIENEVGEVGIDGGYLRREGLEVQEMFGGCVCCTLSVDLVTTIKKLERFMRPEWVILEASGVARPGDVVPVVRKYASTVHEIRVLVLVDAPRYEMLLEVMHPLVTAQIGAADIVAVNKIDALDEAGIERVASGVRELNGRTRVVAVSAEQGINLEALMDALR